MMIMLAVTLVSLLPSVQAGDISNMRELQNDNPMLNTQDQYRALQAIDYFDSVNDLCDNRPDGTFNDGPPELGPCDPSRFPTCTDGVNEICYNRKPSRDHFVPGTHQPVYYIQYDRVFCYPNYWGGCSSCTPGRYCVSEKRCILDEIDYPCEQWF